VAYLVKSAIYTYLDIQDDNINEIWINDKPFLKAFADPDNPVNFEDMF
jgi:hypothetical protein